MFKGSKYRAAGVAAVLSLAACRSADVTELDRGSDEPEGHPHQGATASSDTAPRHDDRGPTPGVPRTAATKAHHVKTLDDQLLDVAAEAPSFAGTYYDDDGQLVVRTTRAEELPAARLAFAKVFPARAKDLQGSRSAGADYTFADLKHLHDEITPSVLSIPHTVLTDVNEKTNRVTIGVENADVTREVERVVAKTARTRAMIEIVEMAPILPTGVQDGYRPVTGGLKMETPGKYCTVGFSAMWGGTLGFVSNSHCTQTQGGVESTLAHQPVSWMPAGTELIDPVYASGGSCPAGRVCRYSDSAFFQANTTFNPLVAATPGPFDLNIGAWLEVPSKVSYPSQGQVVSKTGLTSGTTSGTIQWACATVNSGGGPHTYYCNYIATNASQNGAPGDSGSPVYFRSGNNAFLTGIMWGAGSNPWNFAFAPLGTVEYELGILPYCQGFTTC